MTGFRLAVLAVLLGAVAARAAEPTSSIRLPGPLLAFAVSADSKAVATLGAPTPGGGASELRVWDLTTGKLTAGPYALDASSYSDSLALSPDGKIAVVGGADDTVRVFDLAGKPVRKLHVPGRTIGARFDPEGRSFATLTIPGPKQPNEADTPSLESLQVWDVMTLKPTGKHITGPQLTSPQAFADSGRLNPPENKVMVQLRHPVGKNGEAGESQPLKWAASRDGKFALTGGFSGTVAVHDMATGKPIGKPILLRKGAWVTSLAFAPDGQTAAATTLIFPRGGVALWFLDLQKPAVLGDPIPLADPTDQRVTGAGPVAFTPDGRAVLASVTRDGPGIQTSLGEIQTWTAPVTK